MRGGVRSVREARRGGEGTMSQAWVLLLTYEDSYGIYNG